jgi:hypothetical protein
MELNGDYYVTEITYFFPPAEKGFLLPPFKKELSYFPPLKKGG